MMPSNNELSRISKEINGLTVKRQQLLERKKMLCIFDELKSRIESKQLFKTGKIMMTLKKKNHIIIEVFR